MKKKKYRREYCGEIKRAQKRLSSIPGEALARIFAYPEDVCCGAMRITMIGRTQIWVENYRSIVEYQECVLMLKGKKDLLTIEGKHLTIEFYTGEDLLLRGLILAVRYEG